MFCTKLCYLEYYKSICISQGSDLRHSLELSRRRIAVSMIILRTPPSALFSDREKEKDLIFGGYPIFPPSPLGCVCGYLPWHIHSRSGLISWLLPKKHASLLSKPIFFSLPNPRVCTVHKCVASARSVLPDYPPGWL